MKNPHIASAKRFPADPAVARAGMEDVTFHDMPFDRLVHDSVRALELFDFEYAFEMYKPAAQRRSGYFALPILLEDRLVGKLDAAADRAVDGPPERADAEQPGARPRT